MGEWFLQFYLNQYVPVPPKLMQSLCGHGKITSTSSQVLTNLVTIPRPLPMPVLLEQVSCPDIQRFIPLYCQAFAQMSPFQWNFLWPPLVRKIALKTSTCFCFLFLNLAALGLSYSMQDLLPWPGIEPGPLHWEHRVLSTGASWKCLPCLPDNRL